VKSQRNWSYKRATKFADFVIGNSTVLSLPTESMSKLNGLNQLNEVCCGRHGRWRQLKKQKPARPKAYERARDGDQLLQLRDRQHWKFFTINVTVRGGIAAKIYED
jgi:hypothetical protein